jgi:hypothetical protein
VHKRLDLLVHTRKQSACTRKYNWCVILEWLHTSNDHMFNMDYMNNSVVCSICLCMQLFCVTFAAISCVA